MIDLQCQEIKIIKKTASNAWLLLKNEGQQIYSDHREDRSDVAFRKKSKAAQWNQFIPKYPTAWKQARGNLCLVLIQDVEKILVCGNPGCEENKTGPSCTCLYLDPEYWHNLPPAGWVCQTYMVQAMGTQGMEPIYDFNKNLQQCGRVALQSSW